MKPRTGWLCAAAVVVVIGVGMSDDGTDNSGTSRDTTLVTSTDASTGSPLDLLEQVWAENPHDAICEGYLGLDTTEMVQGLVEATDNDLTTDQAWDFLESHC